MRRPGIAVCWILLAGAWLGTLQAVEAQGPRTVLPHSLTIPAGPFQPGMAAASTLPDSVLASRGSYWKEGLVVGAVLGALLGPRLLGPFCATSEPAGNACVLPDIAGYAVSIGTGSLLGALLGRAVRR